MNQHGRIGAPQQADYRARFTTAEFLQMREIGEALGIKLELVHGELERMTPPMDELSKWQGEVYFQLRQIVGTGEPFQARVEIGIDLGEDTVLGCDVALVDKNDSRGQRMLRPDEVRLVVEVAVTSLRRDTILKCREYARAGIKVYWVVDSEHELVKVFTDPANGDYGRMISVPFGEPLAVPCTDRTITLG